MSVEDTATRSILNRVWGAWRHGSLGFWVLLVLAGGALVPANWQPSAPREAEQHQRERCVPLARETTDPAAWDALADAGWIDQGDRLVPPSCSAVVGAR